MALYEVTGPDGKKYRVEGPEGATDAQIIAAVEGQLREERASTAQQDYFDYLDEIYAKKEQEEETDLIDQVEEFGKGLIGGAAGLVESAALGAIAPLPEDAEQVLRGGIQAVGDFGEEYIYGADKGSEDLVGRKFGEALGSFGGILGASLVNPLLGAGLAVGAGAGEASERARAGDATEGERAGATALGAVVGASELIPIKFIKVLGEPATRELKKIVQRSLASAGVEGAQEAVAGIAQNLIEQNIYNPEQGTLEGSGEALGYGAGVGGLVQALFDLATPRTRTPGDVEPTTEPTQGELFAGEDLGAAPIAPTTTPAQQELFSDSDLGRAPERAGDPDQLDLFAPRAQQPEAVQPDMVEEAESAQLREIIDADETAQIQAMLDADAKAEAELRQEQETRAASDVETIAGQLDTQQQQTTEQRRTAILQDVIENTPTRQEDTLTKNFSRALEAQGIANTQPNESETRTIKRAIDVQRAERPAPVEEPEVKPKQFQVVDGKRVPRTEVPFVPERLSATETRSVTKKDMDDLGIKPAAPVRKRIEGKDVTTPEVQQELKAYANLPAAPKEAKEKIGEQLDLFAPRKDVPQDQQRPVPARDDTGTDRASFTPAGQPRVGSPDTARTPTPTGRGLGDTGVSPARPTRRTTGSTTPLEPVTPKVTTADVQPVAEAPKALVPPEQFSDEAILAAAERGDPIIIGGRDAAAEIKAKETPTEGVAKKAAPTKRAAAKKAAPKKAAAKKATAKKVAPKKAATKTKKEIQKQVKDQQLEETVASPAVREESSRLEFYTSKFKETPKATFVNKDGDTESISLDVNTTEADDAKILDLLKTQIPAQQSKKKGTETTERAEARAAQIYFRKQENPNDALEVIAHEISFADKQFRAAKDMSDGERAYFAETGSERARIALRWVRKNLDANTNKSVDKLLEMQQQSLADSVRKENTKVDFVETERKQVKEQKLKEKLLEQDERQRRKQAENEYFEFTQEDLDLLPDYLREDAVVGLDIPTHPVIGNLLRQGKLVEALRALQTTSPSSRVSQLAGALAKVTGDTKVEVKQFVTDEAGNSVAGKFDPVTNTITLDAETGITPHTLLHEMTHAATSQTLANKSHPLTKQLTKLFNDVKDSLDTAYGSQSVDEFVAEAFSNPEFQRTLAGINIKGEPISALQRFFNSVRNILRRIMGMQTKPVDSALTSADQLIDAMLAPAPQSRFAGEMYMINDIMGMVKNMAAKQKVPATKNDKVTFTEKVKDFIDGRGINKAKEFLLFSLPLQAVVDLSVKFKLGTAATKLQKVVEEQIGETNKADERVDGTLKVMGNWIKTNPELKETLDRVVYRSTIEGVDPSKPESDYKTPEQLKAWKDMQPDWRALSAKGGDKIYAEMRDAYKKIFNDLKAVVGKQIDDTIADPAERKKLRESVYEKMFDGKTIEPYFPLTRKGDLWIRYDAFNERTQTTEPVYESFETYNRRRARLKELDGDPRLRSEPKEYANIKSITFGDAPSGSFMRDALDILKANQPKNPTKEEAERYEQQKEQLMRLFIQALPETSFAKSMQKREGYEGYNTDSIEAFRDKAYDLSRQVQRLKYSNEIRAVEDELRTAWKATSADPNVDSEKAQLVLDELLERASFARNPPNDLRNQLAAQANRIAFLGTIGFNVSSAVVNLSQVPLIMIPLLTGRYRSKLGIKAPTKALGRAMATITGSGFSRKLSKVDEKNIDAGGMPSIDNYYETLENGELVVRQDLDIPDKKREILERYKPVVKMAEARGLLNRSLFYDTLSLDKAGRNRNLWETTNAFSAFVFHTAERLNRQVALLASFDLELARMEKDGETINDAALERAASSAVYQTTEMNGGAALATAPRISQQGLGRVAMMYKSYGIQMYYTLFKTADRALRRMENDKYPPEVVKAARDQFVGVALSSGLLAGVQGMPLVGGFLMLANMVFYDDDELDAETVLRQHISELAYKGPLNAITGTDVASRIGLSNLLYRENPYSQSGSAADRAMELLGGPAWSVATQFGRGIKEVTSPNGNFERGVETMMPAAFRNVYKGLYRYPRDEGILTRRGDVIHDDITAGGALAQAMGFAPTEYTLKQEQNQQVKRIERTVGERRTKLLREYYVAYRFGDHVGVREALKKMQKFSRSHPSVAITPDTIQRSMAQHTRTSATMHNGVTLNARMRGVLQNHVDDYWGSSFGFAGD